MTDNKKNKPIKTEASFWTKKYLNEDMGWDLGAVSLPLKSYIDSQTDRNMRILVPGAGMGWEVEYLHHNKFKNVFLMDISPVPLEKFKNRVPDFPTEHLIEADFFDCVLKFDLILEQTFFCAINPALRKEYVRQVHSLLNDKGRIAGLLFASEFTKPGPPFGGVKAEYEALFSEYFQIHTLEIAGNSHPARMGNELFFEFEKKSI